VALLQLGTQARGWPGDRVKCRVASAEPAASALGNAGLQAAPDWTLACGRAADHSRVIRQLTNHPHLGGEAVGSAVFHQAAVDPVGGACGATADVRRVDVEDVQRLGLTVFSSFRG
jgi:hypothetical protein